MPNDQDTSSTNHTQPRPALDYEEIPAMLDSIKRFVRDESGLETVEWAIVGGLVVAVGAIVFTLIGAT